MDASQLIQTLGEAFIALSDEVQSLIDRKTILEHKLRYAHEQYQYLADKYAPAVQDVSETLAKLQLPPELEHPLATATSAVPLPRRGQPGSSQHQIALLIREGRKAAQQLIGGVVKADREGDAWSGRGKPVSLYMEAMPSVSTALEKDFTVQGKKGALACPFSTQPSQAGSLGNGAEQVENPHDPADAADPTPHRSSDPICAAMLEDVASAPAPAASKCPIRFLDKHSPEEIAHYIETHKHDIPRSHEVCVRRYQRNEEQIRKLDAKYGNLVSMVKDLSNLHRPMLPPSRGAQNEVDGASNKRVEDWAQTVVAGDPDAENEPPVDEKRESHFDRPLRDVRVGESPSRPWGISVPLAADAVQQRGLSPARAVQDPPQAPRGPVAPRRCPFDHSKLGLHEAVGPEHGTDAEARRARTRAEKDVPPSTPQPTFVNLPDMPSATAEKDGRPQIVFNISGPVFIGYPMEQAIEFLKRSQGQ